jgi:DNA-binding transcriptional LysR family regulator
VTRTTDSDLTPQELRVLLAVADSGGFSAAAGTLGLTQSAVSHSVRGSERRIGAVLFERGRTGARPTPAGEQAVAYARRVLRLLDVLTAEARGAARPDAAQGPLRIAAFRSAALHLLPAVLERLRARYPGIEPQVRIVREVGRGTAGEVADGKADIAIATLGGSVPLPPGLVWSRAGSSKSRMRWCTRRVMLPRARCRWSTGPRTVARTPAAGGLRRTGSRRQPSRPRTTERCSPW